MNHRAKHTPPYLKLNLCVSNINQIGITPIGSKPLHFKKLFESYPYTKITLTPVTTENYDFFSKLYLTINFTKGSNSDTNSGRATTRQGKERLP